ncbi:hypothetical protein ABZX92_29800, partial [Lentzea sp. NPDC006480]
MAPGVYDKDGFKLGPNGGIFADPTANLTDNNDFESWDWKQIRAAVIGYSVAPASAVPTSTPSFADPDSIRNASVVFNRARAALQYVGDNVRLQTEALAGENGAWKSPAADAFRSMNLLFAAKLEAKAEQINGGEIVGTNNVPAQLWSSGNYLEWAQKAIAATDSYYAAYIASVGVTMANGLVRISDFPELVAQMTEDMKKIVRILVQQYVMNTNSVTPPDPAEFNATPDPLGADGNQPPSLDGAGGGAGDIPLPAALDVPSPLDGAGGGAGGGAGDIPLPAALDVPLPPGGAGGGAGGIPLPAALDVPLPPGGGAGGIPLPSALTVPRPPGSTGATGGGTGGVGGGIKLPPALSTNQPATGNDGGTGGDNVNLPKPPPLTLEGPPGTNLPNDLGGAVPPSPMMPPPAGTGGGGPGAGAERPDSSGLLGGIDKPWEAGSPPLSDPGGVNPPVTKPEDWAAPPSTGIGGDNGAQMPGAPMMPPPAGMGGQTGGPNAERPDSSGLLGGEKKPWEGAAPQTLDPSELLSSPSLKPEDWATGDPGSSGSTPLDLQVPGGEGLQLPGGGLPPAADLANPSVVSPSAGAGGQVPLSGVPMMPPPSGVGGQPGGTAAERPDSSGLLGGVNEPWTGSGDDGRVGGTSDTTTAATPESWAPKREDHSSVAPWAVTPGEDVAALMEAPGAETPEAERPEVVEPEALTPEAVSAEFVEPLDMTPAAAPAGWAASSDVVPAVHDGRSPTAAVAVPGASAITTTATLGSVAPSVPGMSPTGATPPVATPAPSTNDTGAGTSGSALTGTHTSEF